MKKIRSYNYSKNKQCKCGTLISNNAKLCRSCSNFNLSKTMSGKGNPFYGKKHTNKTKKLIKLHHADVKGKNSPSYGIKRPDLSEWNKNHPLRGRKNPRFGKRAEHGKRILYKKVLFRSSWEVKYAKYLTKNHIKWLYESKTFDLGNSTYTPDFYLPESDTYVEIKGWWRDNAKKKFRLFKKKYSDIKIEVLTEVLLKFVGVL
jgi:hypothetical protein